MRTVSCIVFFFFQAEDGIRDYKVTGVQTCALPISSRAGGRVRGARGDPDDVRGGGAAAGRIMEDVMRRACIAATLALLLGGCAPYAWVKPDVTAEVKAHDEATCRAEARNLTSQYAYGGFGAPFGYSTWRQPWTGPYSDLSWQVAAEEREYERCLRR